MMPKRIQRKRLSGWRKPAGAIYVGRKTKWGNEFKIVPGSVSRSDRAAVTELYENWLLERGGERAIIIMDSLEELRGHDLCCWCPLDTACHADVLLKLANITV